VVEGIVSGLVKEGFRVASAKHVSKKDFSMDTEGKDTWRHSAAGANPVIVVSDRETVINVGDGAKSVSLDSLVDIAEDYGGNVVVLEGFSSVVLKDRRVGKIVCVRSREEYDEFRKAAEREVLAYCSVHPVERKVFDTKKDLPAMVEKATIFIEKSRRILEVLGQLPGLDCRKCGRVSCWELAEDIVSKKAKLDDCVPLKVKPELKTTITVGGVEVPVQPFVAEIVRKTVLAMISTQKTTNITGKEQIKINIT